MYLQVVSSRFPHFARLSKLTICTPESCAQSKPIYNLAIVRVQNIKNKFFSMVNVRMIILLFEHYIIKHILKKKFCRFQFQSLANSAWTKDSDVVKLDYRLPSIQKNTVRFLPYWPCQFGKWLKLESDRIFIFCCVCVNGVVFI